MVLKLYVHIRGWCKCSSFINAEDKLLDNWIHSTYFLHYVLFCAQRTTQDKIYMCGVIEWGQSLWMKRWKVSKSWKVIICYQCIYVRQEKMDCEQNQISLLAGVIDWAVDQYHMIIFKTTSQLTVFILSGRLLNTAGLLQGVTAYVQLLTDSLCYSIFKASC